MNVAYDIDDTLLDLRGNLIQPVIKELIKELRIKRKEIKEKIKDKKFKNKLEDLEEDYAIIKLQIKKSKKILRNLNND